MTQHLKSLLLKDFSVNLAAHLYVDWHYLIISTLTKTQSSSAGW